MLMVWKMGARRTDRGRKTGRIKAGPGERKTGTKPGTKNLTQGGTYG